MERSAVFAHVSPPSFVAYKTPFSPPIPFSSGLLEHNRNPVLMFKKEIFFGVRDVSGKAGRVLHVFPPSEVYNMLFGLADVPTPKPFSASIKEMYVVGASPDEAEAVIDEVVGIDEDGNAAFDETDAVDETILMATEHETIDKTSTKIATTNINFLK